MKRIILYIMLLPLFLGACSEDFFDINKNPNRPETATPKLVLPAAIAGSAYVIGGYYQHLGGMWSQHYAQSTGGSQWASYEEYSLTEGDFDRQYRLMYSTTLEDFEYIKNEAEQSQDWTFYFIATVMQAYNYQVLADLYDEIPFSEALKGSDNLTPKFEKGIDIADSLVARIDKAMSKNFNASSASSIGKEDLIFNGDMKRWKQFANTLKLKIYLRWVNNNPTKYSTQIAALIADKSQLLDIPARMVAFKDEQDNRNPFYETFIDRLSGNVVASATLVDTLKYASDPRLTKIFKPSETGSVMVGLGPGRYKEDVTLYANYKNLATPKVSGLDPVYYFSLPEVDFLIAEAELRYGTLTDAVNYYHKGIDDSYVHYGLTPDPSVYATGGVYEYLGLESIITQKWIAAANNRAIESFFDYQRTGYPDFLRQSAISTLPVGEYPRRLLFPDSERKSNPNTPALKAINVKVWWAK